MLVEILSRIYPQGVVERIVEKQMRLTAADGELYDNANAVTLNAVDEAEQYTSRFICRTTARVAVSMLAPTMRLPLAPVRSVSKVEYYDESDTLVELPNDCYFLEADENQTILLFLNLPKLTTSLRTARAYITLDGGYDDYNYTAAPADLPLRRVPGLLESAIQMLAGTRLETDGDAVVGRSVSAMPTSATDLLNRYRILPYGPHF